MIIVLAAAVWPRSDVVGEVEALQPGWRWSESVKPIARTELCESHHIGICVYPVL